MAELSPSDRDSRSYNGIDDDRSLIAALVRGDVGAFEDTLRRHWPGIARFAARTLDDRDLGNDLAQETFIRLWQGRSKLTHAPLRPYLYRVAHNLVMDELRKREVRDRFANAASADEVRATATDHALDQREMHDDVERAVRALPRRRREAFVLAYLHDLSYKEVAEIMNTSVATVRNQISSALAELRHALAQYESRPSGRG